MKVLAGLILTRSSLLTFIFLIQLLVDQKMINETDEFPGHGDDRYIMLLLFINLWKNLDSFVFPIFAMVCAAWTSTTLMCLEPFFVIPHFFFLPADSFSPGLSPHHFASWSGV